MELNIYNTKGEETGKKVDLSDKIFNVEINEHVVYLDVKRILAARRQGTHKAKERSEVKGSRRKLRSQKGSGAARLGDIKSPIFRGGGRVFGPKPHTYNIKVNKKVVGLARKSSLTQKVKDNELLVIQDFDFDNPKTKDYLAILNNFELGNKKTLLVLDKIKSNVILSARNIKNAKTIVVNYLNTYDILNNDAIIATESSVNLINEMFE